MQKTLNIINKFPALFNQLMVRLGGFDPARSMTCSKHEQIRHAAVGLSILMGGTLAFFSGWHTGKEYTDSVFGGLLFGAFWAALIVVLDYLIIINIKPGNQAWVIPLRIFTSAVLSLLVSIPLILVACEGPIVQKLKENRDAKLLELEHKFEPQKAAAVKESDEAAVNIRKLDAQVFSELEGKAEGSGLRGFGPIAERKQASLDSLKNRFSQLEKDKFKALVKINLEEQKAKEEVRGSFATDELAKIRTLFQMLDDPAISIRFILLVLAIVLLEITPLLLKVSNLGKIGGYEEIEIENDTAIKDRGAKRDADSKREKSIIEYTSDIDTKGAYIVSRHDFITKHTRGFNESLVAIFKNAAASKSELEESGISGASLESGSAYIDAFANDRIKELNALLYVVDPDSKPLEKENDRSGNGGGGIDSQYKVVIASNVSAEFPTRMTAEMYHMATSLCAGLSDEQALQAIYDWVHINISYDYNHENCRHGYRTAEAVWADRTGICGESSALYMAMARAAGLKASFVFVNVDDTGEPVNHAAVMVHLSSGKKQLVDVAYHNPDVKHQQFEEMPDDRMFALFGEWGKRKAS